MAEFMDRYVGRGSAIKVAFIAAVQSKPGGQPQPVCLRRQLLTHGAARELAARSIAPSATVVSDGLQCFGAVQRFGPDPPRSAQNQWTISA